VVEMLLEAGADPRYPSPCFGCLAGLIGEYGIRDS
jgi:hypothetical protein